MKYLRTFLVSLVAAFALPAMADNWTVLAFIAKTEVDNRTTAYNYRVYLKDATTGAAISNLCGNGSAYAHVNRAGPDAEWMVNQLRTLRFTLQPVKLYLTGSGSGCAILIIDHD